MDGHDDPRRDHRCVLLRHPLHAGFLLRDEAAGDSLYHLGFLFTLVSLAVALFQLNVDKDPGAVVDTATAPLQTFRARTDELLQAATATCGEFTQDAEVVALLAARSQDRPASEGPTRHWWQFWRRGS